jgi:3-methyladenine DNA glycosylase AlkD
MTRSMPIGAHYPALTNVRKQGVAPTHTRVEPTPRQSKLIMPNMNRLTPGSLGEPITRTSSSMLDAYAIASKVETLIRGESLEDALHLLDPLAFGRTKFPILDRVGMRLGQASFGNAIFLKVLDRMISRGSVGYYVIVGCALAQRLGRNMITCLEKTAEYIVIGDDWAKCDSIAERVWGRALVYDFPHAYTYLAKMKTHDNRWIRRAVGVAVHYFAKKKPAAKTEMRKLLVLLTPMLGERNRDAIKGIGWGLKTIGKHQPKLLTEFLKSKAKRVHPTKLMLRKATAYLPARTKQQLTKQL